MTDNDKNKPPQEINPGSLLLVSATIEECQLVMERLGATRDNDGNWNGKLKNGRAFKQLITGIGIANTAWALGKTLNERKYSLAIQYGIGGAFDPSLAVGTTVEVISEIFAEMGAMSPEGFLDLKQIGIPLMKFHGMPLFNRLDNPRPSQLKIPKVLGVTVNTVSGDAKGIVRMKQIWDPQVESMEGAAFFLCCLNQEIQFVQFRGVSNKVEPRNRDNWKIKEAFESVSKVVLDELEKL